MILESIQFSNIYTITDLQSKLDSGYFDEFLAEFSIYVMTEKGLVKINQDKTIEYNVSVDLSNYIKNTDVATRDKLGIIKVGSGLDISNSSLYTVLASNANIDAKSNKFLVITPSNLNYAVKSALSGKINIDDMTKEEQLKARNVIGAASEVDLNAKQDILTFDDTPTKDSSNPVTSDGVFTALSNKVDTSNLSDYAKFTDFASTSKSGVVKIGQTFGININTEGQLHIDRASDALIDGKNDKYRVIVPNNLNYAVRSVNPEVFESIENTIKKNCIYNLGEQTNLSITLPTTGKLGDWLQFDFLSGLTKTTLEINAESGILGFDLIPESNYIYTIYLDWGMIGKNTDDSINYGWRFNYSEYPLNS